MDNSGISVKTPLKRKIATRVRNIHMLLLFLVIAVITVMSFWMVNSVTSMASENLARFYSIEAVNKFNLYINEELALVKKVAHSKVVSAWFADEENQEKKIAAYYEMMDYASLINNSELYFGIHRSLNEYSLIGIKPFEDLVSKSTLTKFKSNGEINDNDRWFFDCIFSRSDYILNIDTDKSTNKWRMWINHKVKYNGNLVGVVCSGLRIEGLLSDMFARYNPKNVKGFVIEKDGLIQMDSSDYNFHTGAHEKHIRDASPDPSFVKAIDLYLYKSFGTYNAGTRTQVIKLSKGPFGFASIAPIHNTTWSVVIFFNNNSLFSFTNLLPLVLVMLTAFILYSTVGNTIIQRLVLKPLNRLTASLSQAQGAEINIFGRNRDDEIGDLARTIHEMRDNLNLYNTQIFHATSELERHDQLMHAVNKAAAILLSFDDDNDEEFEESLHKGMKLMADCVGADRVSIWRNEIRYGELWYIQQYTWMNEIGRQSNPVPSNAAFPYSNNPEWESAFLKGKCINGPIGSMPKNTQEMLKPCHAVSILLIPVYLHENFWGFFNFDDCCQERSFTEDEIDILHSACLMMVSAVSRNTQDVKIRQMMKGLEKRDTMLQTVNQVASILLQSEVDREKFVSKLWFCMGMMAGAVNADRVYIWKNHTKDGKLYCTQLYEWSEGAEPQQGNELTVDIPYDENIPKWEEKLSSGYCINSIVKDLSAEEQAQLIPQGIISILVVPVYLQDYF